jgi:UDP-N-acetylglucosamine--N-acetylmuramyl-(pentapeptide) pyrophosphoryl-undecaprenol N-acetylglucosamine transferase
LVFGGSQGARFFSECVPPALAALGEDIRHRLEITQQCRPEDLDAVRAAYGDAGITALCEPFFTDLPRIIAESHLVIGRAGASSVAELTVIGRPSILVPLPHALDNDQLLNASSLANAGGAICIAQADMTEQRLRKELIRIMSTPDWLLGAAAKAKSAGRPDAVLLLADLVEDLAETKA